MKKTAYKRIGMIGTGMVGTAIGVLLTKAGHRVVAVYDIHKATARKACSRLGCTVVDHAADVACEADWIFITTHDSAIHDACVSLASNPSIRGKMVIHMSGAGSLDLLNPALAAGARIACIHPLQSFSSIDSAIAHLPGSYFGITAGPRAQTEARRVVSDLKGVALRIAPEQKSLYHAAACVASNYLVSLYQVVESLSSACGISEKDARKAFRPLIAASLDNVLRVGPTCALTGPIARGDVGTVLQHLDAIVQNAPESLDVYTALAKTTLGIARKKGTLTLEKALQIDTILKRSKP